MAETIVPPTVKRSLDPTRTMTVIPPPALPSATILATSTVLQQLPSSILPTKTQSPYEGAYVHGVTHLDDGRSMVRMVLPAGIEDGEYEAFVTVSSSQLFRCFEPAEYDDRLYCVGPMLPSRVEAIIEVIRVDDAAPAKAPIFSLIFVVPPVPPTPTPPPVTAHEPPPKPTPSPSATHTSTAPSAASPTATPTITPVPPTATESEELPEPTNTPVPPTATESEELPEPPDPP